ncbi:MAG: domain S-box protein [Bacteroidetes bacterium]|jgi:two-component system CheB/CheR fusion protein|nr:domain S-box protein [Bacteroidota bacterium]MDF2451630.1 domain S-box protein [Bacteroidota bacterium]
MLKKTAAKKTKTPVKKATKERPVKQKPKTRLSKKEKHFPVVAIGSSAGGIKALTSFFKNLPAKTGMAYIIVQHLSKDHESFLTEILSKTTLMRVQEIDDMELMKPDNVYVIPYNKGIEVTDGHIRLIPRDKGGIPVSIDVLFTSLAETHGKNVIGIILSGNGNDGTKGLRAIKNVGGITFAQDDSAQSGSMPESAIAEGSVDHVLSAREIAKSLAAFSKNKFKEVQTSKEKSLNDLDLKKILVTLYNTIHVDFSRYKMTTVKRRINHRIHLCDAKNLKEYAELLEKDKKEVEHLYKDLLINVTSFFRDKDTYQYLKKSFLPALLKKKSPGESLRIWVPACSSGEEAYSIAMMLIELQDRKIQKIPIQIFATDLSEQAIYNARMGEYSQADVEKIPAQQLKRFFLKTGNQYRVVKELRAMCVFAPHNILSDPPFAHLDFISCCNLFIYFDASAQKKALTTLHFALNDGGYLMLGKSESVGSVSPLFIQANKTFKIYSRKKNGGIRKIPELTPRSHIPFADKNVKAYSKKNDGANSIELDKAIDAFLLAKHMPACAIINKDMEIIKFRGSTSFYLNHPSGNASLNILKMTRPEFAFELRSAIQQVNASGLSVRKTNIELNSEYLADTAHSVSLEVCPLKMEWEEPLLLVVFNLQELVEKDPEKGKGTKTGITQKDLKIKRQAEELKTVHAEMHAIIDAKETAFEELQAANEEIVSTNEEFQTLNEELETSKEEIEATNEELITANQELRARNDQLAETYDFAENILMTLHEPFLILDKNLRIRSANDAFYTKFLAKKNDTEGKLLFELGNSEWDIDQLRDFLEGLLKKNANLKEYEITNVFPTIGKKTLLLNARQIVQKSQNEQLIMLAFTDITERTQKGKAEKYKLEGIINEQTNELEISNKALEEKNIFLEKINTELETFTFVSSHDLQEPLRKVKNFTSILLLEEKKNLSRTGKMYLNRMQETVTKMQTLLEDLLAYSRAKNKDYKIEKTDLTMIAKETVLDFNDLVKEKKAVIKITEMCSAKIIRFQFRQVFQNMLSNSLKFAHPERRPTITIKSEMVYGKTLKELGLSSTLKYCHITFSDNGIGFDPKYKERIFEVFQRLHEYDEYKGTGIGLAICKRIIENHNGIMLASGKTNIGATFEIYIPVS